MTVVSHSEFNHCSCAFTVTALVVEIYMLAFLSDNSCLFSCGAVMNNPASFAKHQANPKVAPVIAKMMGKFAGAK